MPLRVRYSKLSLVSIHKPCYFVALNAWPDILSDLGWFIDHGKQKKMYLDEASLQFVNTAEFTKPF
jgi:hypothetical protein